MIKRAEELQREVRKEMLGGQGDVTLVHLLQGEEFQGKGRLFSHNIINPGCSVGFHQHNGDVEAYYVLKGQGVFDDNGVKVEYRVYGRKGPGLPFFYVFHDAVCDA